MDGVDGVGGQEQKVFWMFQFQWTKCFESLWTAIMVKHFKNSSSLRKERSQNVKLSLLLQEEQILLTVKNFAKHLKIFFQILFPIWKYLTPATIFQWITHNYHRDP